MSSRKAKRRIAETYSVLEDSLATKAADEALANQDDSDLFVVDRKGSKRARRKVVKEQERKDRGTLHSATEEHLVRKKMKEMQEREAKRKEEAGKGNGAESMDIWGGDPENGGVTAAPQRRRMASHSANKSTLKVSGPGFSYNPAQTHHQDVLAEASALEMAKREKDAREKASMGPGPTLITNGSKGEDDEESSSDEDDDEEDVSNGKNVATTKKKKEKLSTAQRNKQKRNRALNTEQKRAKVVKDLDKQIKDLPKILKTLEKEKKAKEAKKALKDVLKSSIGVDDGALSYAESGTVPLSDELGGSLRTLIPKGSSVKSMATTYDEAGKTIKSFKSRGGAKKYARPHAAPNVKWVARQKYV